MTFSTLRKCLTFERSSKFKVIFIFSFVTGDNMAAISKRKASAASNITSLLYSIFIPSMLIVNLTIR